MAVSAEIVDIPTATVVAHTQIGAGKGLAVVQTTLGGTSVGCC